MITKTGLIRNSSRILVEKTLWEVGTYKNMDLK
jgi:hypothetical protein